MPGVEKALLLAEQYVALQQLIVAGDWQAAQPAAAAIYAQDPSFRNISALQTKINDNIELPSPETVVGASVLDMPHDEQDLSVARATIAAATTPAATGKTTDTTVEDKPQELASTPFSSGLPPSEKRGGSVQAWTWWVAAVVVILLLVFGLRAMFGGGGDETPKTAEEVAPVEEAEAPPEEEAETLAEEEAEAPAEEETEAPAEEALAEEVMEATTLSMWYHGAGNSTEGDIVHQIIDDFNATQDEYVIDLEDFPEESYNESVVAAALAGNLPDIIDMDGPVMPNWAWAGYLSPLELSPGATDGFLPGALGEWDGGLYSVGLWDAALAVFARRSTLEDNSIRVPTLEEPWTFEEFDAALETLQATGDYEYAFDPGMNWAGEWYP